MQFFETQLNMPLMMLPVRSVLLETQGRKLLISPGSKLADSDYKKMGDVTDLIAPNLFHCGGIPRAKKFFPQAKTWGVKGAKEAKPQMMWDEVIDQVSWPLAEELPMVHVEGMPKANEVVFFDKASRSLLVTDLCFNLQNQKGIGSWLILNMFGTYNKFGVSRFYLNYVKDKAAFQKSMEKILSLDFDNIIVSHGDNYMGGAKDALRKALLEREML